MTNHNFRFVNAVYRTETNPAYAGNPFIEALPALPSDSDLVRALTYLPPFEPNERLLDAEVRIQRLDVLQKICVALPRVVALASAIIKMMVTGYGPRRPFSEQDNIALQAQYARQQSGDFSSIGEVGLAAQLTLALIAAAGCGKSFTLRRIAGLFPPVIYHERLGKWQLPFLFIEMPYDGESVHTLASELFAELDRLIPDAGYTDLFMNRKGLNAEQRLAKALAIAYEHAVGMLIVDESQNNPQVGKQEQKPTSRGKDAKELIIKRETALLKQLITASNTSHIPMLLSATPELKARLGRFSLARRTSGRGSAEWTMLNLSELEVLLKALFRYQYIREPIAYSEQWRDVFLHHTQSIPDIVVKLFEACQVCAIRTKKETITPEMVGVVFESQFVTTKYGIKAIRQMDPTLLAIMSDLLTEDVMKSAEAAVTDSHFLRTGISVGNQDTGSPKEVTRPARPSIPSPKPAQIDVEALRGVDVRLGTDPDALNVAMPFNKTSANQNRAT
jgi:hypothetical protein